ncbi:MAG: hypothetical protein QUU85_01685, partial [Candidatus Eisenbacteria bacterium]|nr:hypothetical protein [Candidatus Eisenbacteria bacterium]
LLILPLLAVAWRAKAGARIRLLAAALAAFLLVVVPPSVHNTRATGRLSFITVSGGLNLWIGNHPGASGGYSEPGGLFLEKDPTGARSASSMAGRRLDAGEASSFFARKALDFLIHRPGEAARLVARKAGYLFSPAEVPQIESMDRLASEHPLLAVLRWIGFPFFLPLALLGIARRRRDRTIRFAASVLLAGAVAHLVFFSTGRYRAAMLPALAVAAGAGVVELLSMIRERQAGRLLLPRRLWPVALGLLLLLLAPRYDRRTAAAWAFHQDGIRYQKLGASRSAAEMFHQALALDPSLGEAWHNLGVIEASEGAVAEAIRDYERALAEIGENPVTLYNLASLYGRIGSDEKALAYLDRSLRADPSAPEVRVDRGIALYRL